MHKKALVFAVSAALVVPCALAQKKGGGEKDDPDQVVELYGKVYPEIVRERGKGATAIGTPTATFAGPPQGSNAIITRNEMESSNSRFGIRGQEKLGGGLKAIFQLETEFHVDNNDSRFAQRDSFVGLTSSRWGTIKLGRMDTPFKGYADDIHEEGFAPLKDLLGNFVKAGGTIYVCSPCFKKRNLDEKALVERAAIVGGAKLVEFLASGAPCITY